MGCGVGVAQLQNPASPHLPSLPPLPLSPPPHLSPILDFSPGSQGNLSEGEGEEGGGGGGVGRRVKPSGRMEGRGEVGGGWVGSSGWGNQDVGGLEEITHGCSSHFV